jgi:two-component system, sensor histidine kinase and response regulator
MSGISGILGEKKIISGNDTAGREDVTKKDILNMINCPTILTGMSHEMRTHMNSIVAFSFLMNNGECGEGERNEYSNQILSSCEQLMVLFDNFLDSAIIDTGNSKAEPRACNLGNILDDLLSEFRVILKREDHKDLVLILENQVNRQTEVLIDSNRVSRVIRNLFQNALHNTRSGYIKIGYYFRDGIVTFYVLDSGQGFLKCREFLNSENLNESLTLHNDTCSAINLTLARKLITLMEGKIWVESNGPAGTGMYFSVPAREANSPKVSINHYNNTRIAI